MQIKENVSLKNYNTYKTGGSAKYFAGPATVQELKDSLLWAEVKGLPHEIIGWGANILVSDKGFDGLIISLREFEKWAVRKDNSIIAGAGVLLNEVVRYATDESLGGIQNLAGIPGTIGGAVRMNAGAYGTEMKDIVSRINVIESLSQERLDLKDRVINNTEAEFGYRRADGLMGKIVTAVEMTLTPDNKEKLNEQRIEILNKRSEKQPLSYPSCGSVFKRPEGGYAGELIERCGLKGLTLGGAQVSHKHANFIINSGNATSNEIYSLIQHVKYVVSKECGVFLEEEVRYLGDFDPKELYKLKR